MINSALCQDEDLAPYFLPVDFNDNKTAIRTNIRSKQLALQSLSADIPLLIFPSGFVSTAGRFGFGPVKDAPWTTFTAKLIKSSQATVIPVFFHGQNSRKFHIASHIAEPLRMGLLAHEALKKFNQTINVSIGAPMNWSSLQNYTDRRQLTDFLYQSVQKLQQSDN
jgi:putative hemolysin